MRIEFGHKHVSDANVRVAAKLQWEDTERPEFELYFDTDPRFVDDVDPNPNAFLIAAVVPAMFHGEARIRVEGHVCPQLRRGLIAIMRQLDVWYHAERSAPLIIEAGDCDRATKADAAGRHVASFMSGGIDALTVLRQNRLELAGDHPGSIRDCLFVHGLDLGSDKRFGENEAHYRWAVSRLEELGRLADFSLIPIRTNAALLGDDYKLFVTASHGAVIASIAHAFSSRIGTALIASSASVFDSEPWGSSPLLDPYYSSSDLTIRHDSACFTRLEKVRFVSEWPEALSYVRVCHDPRRGEALNCGRCEKCLRTMVALVICGKLQQCNAFADDDVSAELLSTLNTPPENGALPLRYLGHASLWRELLEPVRAIGRGDLAAVIERKLAEREAAAAGRPKLHWIRYADRLFKGLITRRAQSR
jgi:hypothetical protein